MTDRPVQLTTSGPPETVLPPEAPEALAALVDAMAQPATSRRDAVAAVTVRHPRFLDAWARLGQLGRDDIERYACFRVGYHRGLDTLRGSGWRGSGYVRWQHETNRGFLRALEGLRASAEAIGRVACEELAALFECNAAIVSPGVAARAKVLAAVPDGAPLSPSDMAAASFVLVSGEPAGRGAPRLNPAEWLFYPVRSEAGTLAAMGLARDDGQPPVPRPQVELLVSLLDQCALALVRAELEVEMRGVAQLREHVRAAAVLAVLVGAHRRKCGEHRRGNGR